MRRTTVAVSLLLLGACDAAATAEQTEVVATPEAQAAVVVEADSELNAVANADAKIEIAADAFKLDRVTALVQDGKIETAAELELAVNDPEAEINRIDIDADGQIDHVEVIETRGDAKVDFQMRVIPSSRASVTHAVNLASASVVAVKASEQVSFSASFSAGVSFNGGASASAEVHSFVAPARFEASAVVVSQPLLAWAFVVERPVYHSIHVEAGSGRWIPPGHLKHGHWKATGDAPGGGHGKFKGGGGGHVRLDVGGGGKPKGHASVGGHAGKPEHGHGGHGGGKSSSKPSGPAPKHHASKADSGGPKGGGSKGGGGGPKGGGGSKGDGGSKGGGGSKGKGK